MKVFSVRLAPVPCQVPKNEIFLMSSVPSVVMPALDRSPYGALESWPSRISTPLGTPVSKEK